MVSSRGLSTHRQRLLARADKPLLKAKPAKEKRPTKIQRLRKQLAHEATLEEVVYRKFDDDPDLRMK